MRIECERCKKPAVIYTRKKQTDTLWELFCTCKDPECSHSFVMSLAFARTISPSLLDFPQHIRELIGDLSKIEIKQLLAQLETTKA